MTDYSKLVKALRHVGIWQDCNECEAGRWYNEFDFCLFKDAADAIEELEYEIRESMQKCAECGDANIPKHGEWVEEHAGPGLSNYKCSLCGKICGTWKRGLEPNELPNWCGNCGADMRKMEVQINGFNKK